jgi:hypothetical protein
MDSGILPSGLRPSLRLPKIAPGNFVERARGSGWASLVQQKSHLTSGVAGFLARLARASCPRGCAPAFGCPKLLLAILSNEHVEAAEQALFNKKATLPQE